MARTVSVVFLLAGSSAARADTVSGTIEPGITATRVTRTDEAGRTTKQEVTDLTQQYSLSLDQRIYPNLGFSGTGTLLKDNAWTRAADGTTGTSEQTSGVVSTRLSFGTGLLGGALSFDRRQEAVGPTGAWAVGNTYAATAGWHPLDLPTLDLRVARSDQHDPTTPGSDAVTWDGLVAVGYKGIRDLDLRLTVRASEVEQSAATTGLVSQDARASYHASLLDGRTTAYVGGGISTLWTQTTASGAGAIVLTQRFPIAGLSVIEDFPALPENVVLNPNPALVNGDLRTPAAVNLGTSIGATEQRPRDLGVQLADVITRVNRIRVWVDRPLPAAIAGAYVWDAYQSDDGVHWTTVGIAGPVTFSNLENRFEIPIVETAARYLKVVTRPITPAVTTDPRWGDVWVTELQLFDAQDASAAPASLTRTVETFNGTAQTRLLSSPDLTHDISASVTHPTDGSPTTWLLVNGLSLTHRTTPTLTLSGRVADQESNAGNGTTSTLQWTGTASHRPLPTLSEGFTYGGQAAHSRTGTALTHTASAFGRAELYTGVAATGNATLTLATSERGATSRTTGATVGGSVVPNPILSFAGTWGLSETHTEGGGGPVIDQTRQRLDGTATLKPVPALFASAGVTRVFGDGSPSTQAHFTLNLSPFPNGDLLARFTYSDSIDTATDSRTRLISPTLRWTIRSGAFLDLSLADIRTTAAVEATHIQTASANLTITL